MKTLVARIERYITDYVSLLDLAYSLPIALWILGTYCFEQFDAYPYLVITSATKRSGKSRLKEMISFACSNPLDFAAMTGATMFRAIEGKRKPTILFDEAEKLNSEAASTMRSVLNVGYRKGQTIPRIIGSEMVQFPTYCPKAFVLIGDVYDTLRDRSIVITMRRAEPAKRFTFDAVMSEGEELRRACKDAIKAQKNAISSAFHEHAGLPFLMDRDEEIWTSLFVLCAVFCPDRIKELETAASDMCAEKTAESRRYIKLEAEDDDPAKDDDYRKRLLLDLHSLFVTGGFKAISSQDALQQLLAIPTSPWRRFKGDGLTANTMADMLSLFHVRPVLVQLGKGREGRTIKRGYKSQVVFDAVARL